MLFVGVFFLIDTTNTSFGTGLSWEMHLMRTIVCPIGLREHMNFKHQTLTSKPVFSC